MQPLTARFALLSSFCCLAALPLYSVGVSAAVIARSSIEGRHHPWTTTENESGHSDHTQSLFSFPWSQKKGDSDKVQRRNHKPRSHRSIVVPNSHGSNYAINHRRQATTPQWVSAPQNSTLLNGNASTTSETEGVPGTVAIMSYTDNPDKWHQLASLLIVEMNGTYVLDASTSNRSTLNLINAPAASSSAPIATSTNDTIPVKLTALFSDGRSYCATYNPDPPAPEPLTMDLCNDDSVARKSQIFFYNGGTGVVQPTWSQAGNDSTANTQDEVSSFSSSATPSYPSSATPGIASPSAGANLASWSRRDDTTNPANSAYEQNVTLVFIPQRAAANNVAISASVSTSTYTQTVTVYSSGSPSSLNAAEATPSTTNSSVPAAASATGLNVEVAIGGGSSSPSAGSTYVSSSAPAAAASGSLNAADIASSIAASYSASSASAFASSSTFVVASASASSDIASASPSVTPTFVAAIQERDSAGGLTAVSTDPYFWRFRSDRN